MEVEEDIGGDDEGADSMEEDERGEEDGEWGPREAESGGEEECVKPVVEEEEEEGRPSISACSRRYFSLAICLYDAICSDVSSREDTAVEGELPKEDGGASMGGVCGRAVGLGGPSCVV